MAWAPDYISSDELKHYNKITNDSSDAEISFAISAASRAIDAYCGRQFGQLSAAAPRYYTAFYNPRLGQNIVYIEDLMTTTDLVIKTNDEYGGAYTNTLTVNTDYVLYPYNAAADGKPWTAIVGGSNPAYELPLRLPSVEITARWGWSAVPAVVEQACLFQAARFLWRRNAPAGIAGSPEAGSETRLLARLDPDVQLLLSGVRKMWGAV